MALTDSLISYWKLDEASGNALDAHTGGNDLSASFSAPGSAAGKIGTARDFERDNDPFGQWFFHASNAGLQTGDIDFTFAAWVQLESKPAGFNLYIASKADDDPSTEWALFWRGFGGTDRFRFTIAAFAVNVDANNLGSPSTGAWYYVVCWHDSTANTINIQVNNGTVDSQATGGTAPTAGAGTFEIGNFAGGTPFEWDGLIDEAAFWKRVLTAQERSDLYNGGAGLAYPLVPVVSNLHLSNHSTTGRPPNP